MKVVSLKESDNHSGMASPHVTGERQEIGQRGDNEKTRTGERETAAVEPEEAELNTEVQRISILKKTDRLKPPEAENVPEMKKTGPETFGRD